MERGLGSMIRVVEIIDQISEMMEKDDFDHSKMEKIKLNYQAP